MADRVGEATLDRQILGDPPLGVARGQIGGRGARGHGALARRAHVGAQVTQHTVVAHRGESLAALLPLGATATSRRCLR